MCGPDSDSIRLHNRVQYTALSAGTVERKGIGMNKVIFKRNIKLDVLADQDYYDRYLTQSEKPRKIMQCCLQDKKLTGKLLNEFFSSMQN